MDVAQLQNLREAFEHAEMLYERAQTAFQQANEAPASELIEARRAKRRRLELVTERERIAGDLHAGTIRFLHGLGIRLQAIESRSHETAISSELRGCVDDLDRAIRELRSYVFGLDSSDGLPEEDPGL